jgi:signal peptidase I
MRITCGKCGTEADESERRCPECGDYIYQYRRRVNGEALVPALSLLTAIAISIGAFLPWVNLGVFSQSAASSPDGPFVIGGAFIIAIIAIVAFVRPIPRLCRAVLRFVGAVLTAIVAYDVAEIKNRSEALLHSTNDLIHAILPNLDTLTFADVMGPGIWLTGMASITTLVLGFMPRPRSVLASGSPARWPSSKRASTGQFAVVGLLLGVIVLSLVVGSILSRQSLALSTETTTPSLLAPTPVGPGGVAQSIPLGTSYRRYFVPSDSMEPTLQIHDVVLVDKSAYAAHGPHDGDIIVFPPPIESTNDFMKRLIGSPGETLRVHEGIVYRNGTALGEPYEAQKPLYEMEIKNYGVYVDGVPLDPEEANIPPRNEWEAPDRIPPGCYFTLGDNRNNSEDSHIWGFIQIGGTFATGPEAGHAAGFTGQVVAIVAPTERKREFPP